MRTRVLPLIFFFLLSTKCEAQWVSIPDTNFGTWLNTYFSGCMQGNNQSGWQMDTICPAILNEDIVNPVNRNISDLTGIQYFDSARNLSCYGNQLSYLPDLPRGLTALSCSHNQLNSLPALPAGLTVLDCIDNQLSSLPSLPSGMTTLYCRENQISSLFTLPDSLQTLDCSVNQLSNLPSLPSRLLHLNCSNNLLSSLPILNDSLAILQCSYNQITQLPVLPAHLRQLYCTNNLLDSLPSLPLELNKLWCSYNQLSSLPVLPNSISTGLNCGYNLLNTLPELPDSLQELILDGNPLLCMPLIKRIRFFVFRNTTLSCVPNYGNVDWSDPRIDSLPLCDVFNPNGCLADLTISGTVFSDSSSNCIIDSTEPRITNVPVQLWQSGNLLQHRNTNSFGYYYFVVDSLGSYEIRVDTTGLPLNVVCPLGGTHTSLLTRTDSLDSNVNFGLECEPGFDLAAWSITGRFRPADITEVDIHVGSTSNFYGINCSQGISGTVRIVITGSASYVSPAPGALTPDNVSGNVLEYNVADFGNTDFNSSFNIMVQTDNSAQIGSPICFTVTVSPVTGDDVPTNNVQTHCFTVVAAFDPNDKQVYPIADIDTSQDWLTYTINFQNTGTDTAYHIYITDTLDSDVEPSSFQLLAYSHQPMVQLKQNAVRFNFPNIMLVDSHANEPLSHGYVQYKVKLKDNLPIGTHINNTAFIYFDFNAPVVTNTTTNTITVISGLEDTGHRAQEFRIHPNPANDIITISVDDISTSAEVVITDVTGRKMLAAEFTTHYLPLTTSSLSSGVYFVTLTNKEGKSATKKLIIQ